MTSLYECVRAQKLSPLTHLKLCTLLQKGGEQKAAYTLNILYTYKTFRNKRKCDVDEK